MGLMNLRVVETTPGANSDCPFSPPAGWEGDETAYRHLMRSRYDSDTEADQRIRAQVRFVKHCEVEYQSPFVRAARQIINHLRKTT